MIIFPFNKTLCIKHKQVKCIAVVLNLMVFSGAVMAQSSDKSQTCKVSAQQQQLLELHNRARLKGLACGHKSNFVVAKLNWNCKLAKSARAHAKDMARNKFLSHSGSDNSNIRQRAKAAGYVSHALAENVARGFDSVGAVYNGWLSSKDHCKNIMNGDYIDMGAAEVDGYWVVAFGVENEVEH